MRKPYLCRMNRQQLWLGLAFGLTILSLFTGLQVLELRAEEPRRAVIAMEMVLSGNWLVPQIHGEAYYNKPPLFNWLLAVFFTLFGSFEEWVVRLPSLLAFVGTAVLNFFVVRRFISREVALLSSLFYLTAADILYYGAVNAGEIDLFFALLVYGQIIAIFAFREKKKWGLLFVVSYLLAALVFLTKGVPSLAFQVLTVLAVFGYHRAWKRLLSWSHLLGIVVFAAVVFPYFWYYYQQEDAVGFLINLINEASQKSATESSMGSILLHLLEFPLNLLKLTMPWVLLGYYLFRKDVLAQLRSNALVLFSAIFILANIWLYWISPGNRNPYLYPFFPFLFIVLAFFYQQFSNIRIERLYQVAVGLAVIRLLYTAFVMPVQQERLPYRQLTETLLAKAEGEPIYYTGDWYVVKAEPQLAAGLTLWQDTLRTPPLIPYQIPYYITKAQEQPLRFEPQPELGKLYLTYQDFLEGKEVEILYEFEQGWTNNVMALVRFR